VAVFSGCFQVYSIQVNNWKGRDIWNMLLLSAPAEVVGPLIPDPGEPFDVFEVGYFVDSKERPVPPVPGDIVNVEGVLSSVMKRSQTGGFYRKNLLYARSVQVIGSVPLTINIEDHVKRSGTNKEHSLLGD
jgi:hypothetical protein